MKQLKKMGHTDAITSIRQILGSREGLAFDSGNLLHSHIRVYISIYFIYIYIISIYIYVYIYICIYIHIYVTPDI